MTVLVGLPISGYRLWSRPVACGWDGQLRVWIANKFEPSIPLAG
ncbi:hypothetical protein [Spirosoma endophyticum]|nr:hypothetical protein [Spirosoma endophyticum]